MIRRLLLTLALGLALAPPALAADPAIENGSAQAALDAARGQWEREQLANYGYRVRAVCRCPSTMTRAYAVHVRGGKPVRSHRYIRGLDTVEKLFARIQGAIDSGAYFLRVDYGERGVPTVIAINAQEYVLDEEIAHVISRVHAEPKRLPPKVALAILDGTARVALVAAEERWHEAGRPGNRKAVRARFASIATAIVKRARVLEVRYAANGIPTRIRIRPR